MMTTRVTLFSIGTAIILFACGCGSNSTGAGGGRSSVTFIVNDESGKPLPGFTASVSTFKTTALTDSGGIAVIEDVPSGAADVSVMKSGYPLFSRHLTLKSGSPLEERFVYINEVPVTVMDEKGRPVPGADILTKPATQTLTTDSSGRVLFTHMPKTTLTFTVQRKNLRNTDYIVEPSGPVAISVQSGPPTMNILSPGMDDIISIPTNITLKVTGFDFETAHSGQSFLVFQHRRISREGKHFRRARFVDRISYHHAQRYGQR